MIGPAALVPERRFNGRKTGQHIVQMVAAAETTRGPLGPPLDEADKGVDLGGAGADNRAEGIGLYEGSWLTLSRRAICWVSRASGRRACRAGFQREKPAEALTSTGFFVRKNC